MTFIFYDTETTGLNAAFDQITQFAAIVTDDNFQVLEEINLRCRLQPHVLASPGAMFVTKVGPKTIQSAPLSCYQMVCAVRAFIEKWTPAVLIGFNSISYDEGMLRQAFYQQLHPTYLTNTNGNSRMDVMLLAHAVAAHRPDVITVPLNEKGRPTFKLGLLAAANGLSLNNAHDAHADTRATLALARYFRERAPEVWDDLYASRTKALVTKRIAKEQIVLFTDKAFGKPTIVGGHICASPDNPAALAMFDLAYDPSIYLDVDVEKAAVLLKANPRPIRILRANNLPIVRSFNEGTTAEVDMNTARERMLKIRSHPNFARVIAKAMADQYADKEPSAHIEEQIYGGFPSTADASLMETFHKVPWQQRYALSLSFEDDRYQQFAERLIYAEAPDALPLNRKSALDQWRQDRLETDNDVPWLTLSKAKAEVAEIVSKATEEHSALIAEIRSHYS